MRHTVNIMSLYLFELISLKQLCYFFKGRIFQLSLKDNKFSMYQYAIQLICVSDTVSSQCLKNTKIPSANQSVNQLPFHTPRNSLRKQDLTCQAFSQRESSGLLLVPWMLFPKEIFATVRDAHCDLQFPQRISAGVATEEKQKQTSSFQKI